MTRSGWIRHTLWVCFQTHPDEEVDQRRRDRAMAINTETAKTFLNNDPIATADEDRFGRQGFVARLATVIRGRHDPGSLVIGLYGAWGTGKSSVLNLLEQQLRHYRHVATSGEVLVIRFNPWYFADEPQLIRSFFRTLADYLDKPVEGVPRRRLPAFRATLQRYGSDCLQSGDKRRSTYHSRRSDGTGRCGHQEHHRCGW